MGEDQFPTIYIPDDPAYGLELPQTYPWSWPEEMPRSATNPALAASFIAMEGQGRLLGVTVTNTKASAQFFQLFDTSSLPADNAVPLIAVDIAANTAKGLFFGEGGRWMRQGITLCNSSTQGTKTIGSADCLFDVQYVPQVI